MMPKKILDLRKFPGLPKYIVFSDDDQFNKPYSSWDVINNSRKIVDTNMYRRYDVVFSSMLVRERCLQAINRYGCVKAHCSLDTLPCVVHLFDVIEHDTFLKCCHYAADSDNDYVLVIHEVDGVYQVISNFGTVKYGYLSEDLTYDRR